MFKFIKTRKETKQRAALLYEAILKQARQPFFYERHGVPDTVTGRFELVIIHSFLVWQRVQGEGAQGKHLAQALFDVMFRDLSYALRNIGVGDLAVPHHMKRMMRGYKGRVLAYRDSVEAVDKTYEPLMTALRKNLFATVKDPAEENLKFFVGYILGNIASLAGQDTSKCLSGDISWNDEELESYEQAIRTQAVKSGVVAQG